MLRIGVGTRFAALLDAAPWRPLQPGVSGAGRFQAHIPWVNRLPRLRPRCAAGGSTRLAP
jgi:hypothetical protein